MIGKKINKRNTSQKKAVQEMLDSGEWFNVEDLYLALKYSGTRISRATIYNHVYKYYEEGIICQRMLNGKTYFKKL